LVETVFSVLIRKFGEALKVGKYSAQIKELKITLILYNISKIIHALPICISSEEFKEPIFDNKSKYADNKRIIINTVIYQK